MNLRKILSSLFIIILLSLQLNGQKVSKLHKKLYEDYDYFIEIMESNPQLDVRRIVQGVNILDSVKNNRYRVEQCKNYKDFAFLINKMANLAVDGHFYAGAIGDSFDDKAVKANNRYGKYFRKHRYSFFVLPYCEIIDGEFLFIQPFGLGNRNSADTIIPAGAILKSVNGISPVEYTSQFVSRDHRWDWNLNKFVSNVVRLKSSQINKIVVDYQGVEKEILVKPGKHPLLGTKFWVNSDNQTVKHKSGLFKSGIYYGGRGILPYQKGNVWYLTEQKILYIGIPEMFDDENYYVNEILKYKDVRDVEKIVIDIRDNEGGSDLVWINILRHIIDQPLKTELKNILVNSSLIRQEMKEICDFDKVDTITQHQFLPDNKYVCYTDEEIITPSDSSLNYSGKIFVLNNNSIYSAAGCLIAMAEYHSRIVCIGQPTGYLLGRGCTPVVFQLPNSKLGINMHPMIDLTNVSTPEDVFHDKVEIPVKLSAEKWLKFYNGDDEFNTDYLLNEDLWFKEVLEY